ncbi:MAG TPA: sialidase family protein [Terriglobia bacterium]|nr:sialidase family protein [Terriglobia bacterium]
MTNAKSCRTWLRVTLGLALCPVGATIPRPPNASPQVRIIRTPNGGIQPQVAVDRAGVIHMVYLTGPETASDIYYVQKGPHETGFSQPIRVNSVPGSAMSIGTVRGAQIAAGRGGRVYVAWLGSDKAMPRGPGNKTPMLFSRLNDAGTAFEPQKNVMQFAVGLDGGGSVAADQSGNVYVVWHGNPDENGETNRRVWVARSRDEGKTFEREIAASRLSAGACGCCGLRAFADNRGTLYILYRAAREGIHRDTTLLVSTDQAKTFKSEDVAPWELKACPMSTNYISEAGRETLIAWQTETQVYFAAVSRRGLKVSAPVPAPGKGIGRQHPVVIGNSKGQVLFAWTDGTGWRRGGTIGWQVFDEKRGLTLARGTATDLPVWDSVAAFQDAGGGFYIIY